MTTKSTSEQTTIEKKMSIRTLIGSKPSPRMIPAGHTEVYLVRVWGIASGLKSGTSDFGDWTALTGDFKGGDLSTGLVKRTGTLFVPDVLLGLIQPRIEQGQIVEFAFELGIKEDAQAGTGYVYVCRPVQDLPTSDAMARLDNMLPPMLPAPDTSQGTLPLEGKAPSRKGNK